MCRGVATKTTNLDDLEAVGGLFLYVITQVVNNCVAGFYNFYTEDGGVLTVDNAFVEHCIYEGSLFSASDYVEKLALLFKMYRIVFMYYHKFRILQIQLWKKIQPIKNQSCENQTSCGGGWGV